MKVLLFGASGMVGSGVLIECLEDRRVESLIAVTRRPLARSHPKLKEVVRDDFFDYRDVATLFAGCDACFFCLGVSSVGMAEPEYRRLTYDLTVAAAEAIAGARPGMVFCYVSGQGTDGSGKGRSMWARVKGETENRLLRMQLRATMFRPGFIQPVKGVRSKTRLYQTVYTLLGWLFPLLERLVPDQVTTTAAVGRAMIEVAAAGGSAKEILEPRDINALAKGGSRGQM